MKLKVNITVLYHLLVTNWVSTSFEESGKCAITPHHTRSLFFQTTKNVV